MILSKVNWPFRVIARTDEAGQRRVAVHTVWFRGEEEAEQDIFAIEDEPALFHGRTVDEVREIMRRIQAAIRLPFLDAAVVGHLFIARREGTWPPVFTPDLDAGHA
jgi:hypothetical protein